MHNIQTEHTLLCNVDPIDFQYATLQQPFKLKAFFKDTVTEHFRVELKDKININKSNGPIHYLEQFMCLYTSLCPSVLIDTKSAINLTS